MLSRWCRLPVSARGHRSVHKIAKTLAPPEPLKSWQEDAIQTCMTAIHAGRTRIGIQMAQGSQSTLAGLMDQIQQNSNLDAQRRQILVVTESTARGKKIAEKVSKRCPHLKVEIEIKKEKNLMLSHADVFMTTYKIVNKDTKLIGKRVEKKPVPVVKRFDASTLKAVVLDDVDEFNPPSYDPFVSRFIPNWPENLPEDASQPIIIATSSADDSNALRRIEFIEEVVYRRSFLDDLQETWKCNAVFSAVPAPLGLRKIPVKLKSFFHTTQLSKVMRQPMVLQATFQEWLNRTATRKSTLVYCVDDPHAVKLLAMFRNANINARHIPLKVCEAKPKSDDHLLYETEMAAFAAGEFPVLLVPHRNTNAIDLPQIDCVLLAAPVFDRHVLGDMISSGMKPSPDTSKEDTVVIQIVDANRARTRGFSLPDLFLLAPEKIDGQPPDVLRQRAEESARLALEKLESQRAGEPLSPPPQVDVVLLSPTGPLAKQVIQEQSDAALVAIKASGFAKKRLWVRCAPGIYVHDCFWRGHAIIRALNHKVDRKNVYEAFWTPKRLLEGTPARTKDGDGARRLSVPGAVEDVMPQIHEFLRTHVPFKSEQRGAKAAKEQIQALKELCPETMSHVILEGQPMSTDAFLEAITFGEAANALARLRYHPDPESPAFTYTEQTTIVSRIRLKQVPGEILERKRAQREQKRLGDMEKLRKRREKKLLNKEKTKKKLEKRREKKLLNKEKEESEQKIEQKKAEMRLPEASVG